MTTRSKALTYDEKCAPRRPITGSYFPQVIEENIRIQIDRRVRQSRSEMHIDNFNLHKHKSDLIMISNVIRSFTNLNLFVIVNRLQFWSDDFE